MKQKNQTPYSIEYKNTPQGPLYLESGFIYDSPQSLRHMKTLAIQAT